MSYDPKKPNNHLTFLPLDFDFRDPDILIQLGKTNVALAKLNEQAKQIPNQKVLLDFLSVKEGVQSNEIENIHTTVEDVFIAELEEDRKKWKRADKETIHYREAVQYGFSQINDRGFLNMNDYVKMNHILLENTQGIISSPNKVIKNNLSEILYTPPQGIDLIKKLLHNFDEYYNSFDKKEIDPLLKLPMLHYQFEAIHPFGDGNGRTGRILIVLFLVLHDKLDLPILFLSDFISQNKQEYYKFLRDLDRERGQEKIKEYMLWMLGGIEIQAIYTRMSIYNIQDLIHKTTERIRESSMTRKIYSKELVEFLFIRPFYSIEGLQKYLSVHRNTASHYLNLLEKAGILGSFKTERKRIFVFGNFLDTLTKES